MIAEFALFLMVGEKEVICPHNSPLKTKCEAIDIDQSITKQQYTTLFPLNWTWVVERPVVWHANKKVYKKCDVFMYGFNVNALKICPNTGQFNSRRACSL